MGSGGGATAALRKATYDRLTTIRQDRVSQVERWFQDLGNHTLALAAAAWLARSVTEAVLALAKAAHRFGQRDFSVRRPVERKDEIGELAGSFNRMAEELERTTVSRSELEELAGRLITGQEGERQRIA